MGVEVFLQIKVQAEAYKQDQLSTKEQAGRDKSNSRKCKGWSISLLWMTCSPSAFLANLALCLAALLYKRSAESRSAFAPKSIVNTPNWVLRVQLFGAGRSKSSAGETKCSRAIIGRRPEINERTEDAGWATVQRKHYSASAVRCINKAGGSQQDMTGVSRVVFPVIDSATFVLPKPCVQPMRTARRHPESFWAPGILATTLIARHVPGYCVCFQVICGSRAHARPWHSGVRAHKWLFVLNKHIVTTLAQPLK